MTTGNRPIRVSCALAACVAAALLPAGCGGGGSRHVAGRSSEPASQLVSRALGGRAAVRHGQVRLSLSLVASGTGQAFNLRSATRFSVPASGAAPTLAMTLAALTRDGPGPARSLRAALVTGQGRVSLTLQGRHVKSGPQAERALAGGYAQPPGGVASLGLDASSWLVQPRYAAVSTVPGSTSGGHVSSGLAVGPFVADVARLAGLAAALEQAGGQGSAALVARVLSADATRESGTGAVDMYADPTSQLPRSLSVSAMLHPPAKSSGVSPPPVSVSLTMSFSGLDEVARAGSS